MSPALISILIAVMGALTALVERIRRDLSTNTHLTQEAADAANGQLNNTLAQLATARNQVVGLRAIVREREDRIAYIVSRIPEAEVLMRDYRDQRTRHATEAEETAAERSVLTDPQPSRGSGAA